MRPPRVRLASVLVEAELKGGSVARPDVPRQLSSNGADRAPRSSSSAGSGPGCLMTRRSQVQILPPRLKNCRPYRRLACRVCVFSVSDRDPKGAGLHPASVRCPEFQCLLVLGFRSTTADPGPISHSLTHRLTKSRAFFTFLRDTISVLHLFCAVHVGPKEGRVEPEKARGLIHRGRLSVRRPARRDAGGHT